MTANLPGHRRWCGPGAVAAAIVLIAIPMHAALAVFVGEPYGSFGTMMPVGHTSIYLDRVCADGPLRLRMCLASEPQGVVLSRYHAIGRYDWLAIPVMDFLYATERREEIPHYATEKVVWEMRERYRQRYLRAIVPDGMQGVEAGEGNSMGSGSVEEWWESAGMAYNRRIWVYQVATSHAEDERLVQTMNADENRHGYRLSNANCADFAAQLVNFYYPGAVHRDHIADFGWMTPKQVARTLTNYSLARPGMELKVWEIPQVPGTLRRSRPVRGAAETFLKTKRYLFTLIAIQPEVPVVLTAIYVWRGRWKVGAGAESTHVEPSQLAAHSGGGAEATSNSE